MSLDLRGQPERRGLRHDSAGESGCCKRRVPERLGIAWAMVAFWSIVPLLAAAGGRFVGFVRSFASDSDMDDVFLMEMVRSAPFVGMIAAGLSFLAYLLAGRRESRVPEPPAVFDSAGRATELWEERCDRRGGVRGRDAASRPSSRLAPCSARPAHSCHNTADRCPSHRCAHGRKATNRPEPKTGAYVLGAAE